MQYFTKELWCKINSTDKNTRVQAEAEWLHNSEQYDQQFARIKHHLPKSFLKEYISRHDFHDYSITGLSIINQGKTYSCELCLSDGTENIRLSMDGVVSIAVDIQSFQNCIQGVLSWGYSEFDWLAQHTFQLSVLCDLQNELQFKFKRIAIK